jgi:hypothetical protein
MQLKGIRVELGLLDEIKVQTTNAIKQAEAINKAEESLYAIFDNAKKVAGNLEQQMNFGNPINEMIFRSLDRLTKSAKELGVDVNSFPEVKKLKDAEQKLLRSMTTAKQAIEAYKSL